MELTILFKVLFSLTVVFAIMYLILKVIQRYTKLGVMNNADGKIDGLRIKNIMYIDEGMKVVSISNNVNGNEYILGIGKNSAFVIDKYETKSVNNSYNRST